MAAAAVSVPRELPDSRSSTPLQDRPVTHPVADVPPNKGDFFDPTAPGGQDFVESPSTSVSHIFAIMRQWVPKTQKNMTGLIDQLLKRGCHVNDRDGLTDATLLHFACKSAAAGAGDREASTRLVEKLVSHGADVCATCRWTGMVPLHYAAYFDAAPVIDVLVATKRFDIDIRCVDLFHSSTALHIATANIALDAVERLLYHGSNPWLRTSEGCCAIDCIPADDSEVVSVFRSMGQEDAIVKLRKVLQDAMDRTPKPEDFDASPGVLTTAAKREVKIGDRVLVYGRKYGIARYIGRVRFTPTSHGCSRYPAAPADAVWVGVELEQGTGENNGSVDSKEYFHCATRKGTFAPLGDVAVAKYGKGEARTSHLVSGSDAPRSLRKSSSSSSMSSATTPQRLASARTTSSAGHVSAGKSPKPGQQQQCRVSALHAKEMRSFAKAGASQPDGGGTRKVSSSSDFQVGDSVFVSGTKPGVVKFVGETDFAQGTWYGVKLDKPEGKNDGSVSGHQYFSCKPLHGIFAPLQKLSHQPTHTFSTSMPSSQRRHVTPSRSANTPTPSSGVDFTDSVELMNAKVLYGGEMATVRFIGTVDFSDGVWLGVELKTPNGKHDGSVKGRRYFTCKQDYGLMIRPQRATYRGISCASVLGKQEKY